MRWFKRKKEEKTETVVEKIEDEEKPISEKPLERNSEDLFSEPDFLVDLTDPIPAFIKRLEHFLNKPEVIKKTTALKNTRIQLIVGGEPLLLSKMAVQPLSLSKERSTQADVFIHMSEDAARELAMATTTIEFKKQYKQMVNAKGVAAFVTIKYHTPLEELRNKGYFNVELLRILIDA